MDTITYALVHESEVEVGPPWRALLGSSLGDRHAQLAHPIENIAPELGLDPLVRQIPGVKAPTYDGFVPKHPGFDQASAVVA